MEISKKSWHYRFLDWCNSDPVPTSICPYVRALLLQLTLFSASVLSLIFMLVGVFFALLALPVINMGVIGFDWVGALISAVIWVCILIAIRNVITEWLEVYKPEVYEKITIHVPRTKRASLLTQYLKALHDKVCPNIDFTND